MGAADRPRSPHLTERAGHSLSTALRWSRRRPDIDQGGAWRTSEANHATGHAETTAEGVDAQLFFRSKRAAAVLKHAILAKYVVPFAAKTGSTSTGKRVVVVDGYAGAGRYEDGKPGSPALIAEAARTPALKGPGHRVLLRREGRGHLPEPVPGPRGD